MITTLTCVLCTLILLSFIILCLVAYNYSELRKKRQNADIYARSVKEKANLRAMKILEISQSDFHNFLSRMFVNAMIVCTTTKLSDRDPEAKAKLYSYAIQQLMYTLGEDNIKAIDMVYGEGYLERWCEMMYSLMDIDGQLAKIIGRDFERKHFEPIQYTLDNMNKTNKKTGEGN